jgi:DUF4097 and DUF4098 domain-containing protein YvlB
MSKINKVLLIIGTVCVALGVIVSTTAFALARFDLNAFSTVGPYEQASYVAKSADIENIRFYGVSDDVRVERGAVKTIEIDYWQSKDFSYDISENSSGRTLEMKFKDRPLRFLPSINLTGFVNNGTVITIPNDFKGTLLIDSVSGRITVDAPTSLESLAINTVSGDVNFTCKNLGKLSVNGVSANLDFSCGSIGTAKIDTVSGDTYFTSGAIGSLNFNSISGNLEGTIADTLDNYTIDTDTLSGNMNIPRAQKGGDNNLNLDTVSGDVQIEFGK